MPDNTVMKGRETGSDIGVIIKTVTGKNQLSYSPTRNKYTKVKDIKRIGKTNSKNHPTCSVKTNNPVPKKMVLDVKKEIDKIIINTPINIGDVIIKNVLGLGVDIVATSKIKE